MVILGDDGQNGTVAGAFCMHAFSSFELCNMGDEIINNAANSGQCAKEADHPIWKELRSILRSWQARLGKYAPGLLSFQTSRPTPCQGSREKQMFEDDFGHLEQNHQVSSYLKNT